MILYLGHICVSDFPPLCAQIGIYASKLATEFSCLKGKTGGKLALKLRKPQSWEGLPSGVGGSVWTFIVAVVAVHRLLVNLGNLYI